MLLKVNQGQSLVPFLGCLSTRSSPDSTQMMHAWDLFLKYYETKVRLSCVVVYSRCSLVYVFAFYFKHQALSTYNSPEDDTVLICEKL